MRYINTISEKGCFLCDIYKQSTDKKNFVVSRSQYSFVVLNRFPYNNGHLMIVINRHIGMLEKLSQHESYDIHRQLTEMIIVLRKILKPHGFNVGFNLGRCAGAGVDKHLHLHVVPRWKGDTNFMPVLSNTKVISQSLKELYMKVRNMHQLITNTNKKNKK